LVDNAVMTQAEGHNAGVSIIDGAGKDRESLLRGHDRERISVRYHLLTGGRSVEDAFCKLVESAQRAGRLALGDLPVKTVLLARSADDRVRVLVGALMVEVLGVGRVRNSSSAAAASKYHLDEPSRAKGTGKG
jgi:hypothetical protein